MHVTGRVLWDARMPAGGLASGCPAGGSAYGTARIRWSGDAETISWAHATGFLQCRSVGGPVIRPSKGALEVTAWSNFHGPFSMAPVVAGCLGIPTSSLRLIVPADIGGSFGIKSAVYPYIALMALASKHAGRPVRWTEDRLEHLQASSSGSDRLMTFSAAVDADGVVSALRVDLVDNVGAYLRPPEPSTLYRCFGNITGAYRIDEVEIRARAVVTNKAPTGLTGGSAASSSTSGSSG